MLSTNKVVHTEDTFCYRDYMCQVSKLQHMYVIGLILLSVLKTTKQIWLYPATHYCTRLQGKEGKNSIRKRRDILVSDRDQRFFIIKISSFQSMMCYPSTGYIMFSLQRLKFYGGRITQTPIFKKRFAHFQNVIE